ncbi:MAG TPA: SRPBCC family protein [Caulobacteraceae bacterium]|jgi:uncharacterized protein YndB with AHSA1/START domain|nr:SRPBCC family protein [Caulobacteraceae bacterium]
MDDPARLIGANAREVRAGERDGKPVTTVTTARDYDTDAKDLWNALTDPERIPRWFLPITGELKPGGRYQFVGNAGGTIETCRPPQTVAVTWEFGAQTSWVTVTLEPQGDRTRLILEHTLPVDDHWKTYGPGAVSVGWDLALFGLGRHLGGAPKVSPEAAMEWMQSDEAKDLMRGSSEAWLEAWLASGAAPQDAREVAARTTAFYTGGA